MPVETGETPSQDLGDLEKVQQKLAELSGEKEHITLEKKGALVDITVTATNVDKVTGRHHFNEGMRKAHTLLIQNELKAGRTVVYFKIDMRKLKNINDAYGHLVGDQGLRAYDAGLESRLVEQMLPAGVNLMELHRMQSGGDEWAGFLSAEHHTALLCAEQLKPLLVDVPFTFQDATGNETQKLLSAEYGTVIIQPSNLTEQTQALRQVVAPFSLASHKEQVSLDNFGHIAELYDLMDQYAEYQLLKSKEDQHWEELKSTDDLFFQVYNELISEGKLAPMSEYATRQNETLLSYEGFIVFSKRFKIKLALIMSRRLDTQMAYYYIGMVEVITRMNEKIARGESLNQSDLDLLGIQEELAKIVLEEDRLIT